MATSHTSPLLQCYWYTVYGLLPVRVVVRSPPVCYLYIEYIDDPGSGKCPFLDKIQFSLLFTVRTRMEHGWAVTKDA